MVLGVARGIITLLRIKSFCRGPWLGLALSQRKKKKKKEGYTHHSLTEPCTKPGSEQAQSARCPSALGRGGGGNSSKHPCLLFCLSRVGVYVCACSLFGYFYDYTFYSLALIGDTFPIFFCSPFAYIVSFVGTWASRGPVWRYGNGRIPFHSVLVSECECKEGVYLCIVGRLWLGRKPGGGR